MRAAWARNEIIKYYVAWLIGNMRTAMLGVALHRFCKTPPVWSSASEKILFVFEKSTSGCCNAARSYW
jgi:hypothetical protein